MEETTGVGVVTFGGAVSETLLGKRVTLTYGQVLCVHSYFALVAVSMLVGWDLGRKLAADGLIGYGSPVFAPALMFVASMWGLLASGVCYLAGLVFWRVGGGGERRVVGLVANTDGTFGRVP